MSLASYPAALVGALHRIEGFWRVNRWRVSPGTYRWYRKFIADAPKRPTGSRPVVVFDFRDSRIDGPQGRRFYALMMYFVRAGLEPAFARNYLFLATMPGKTKRYALEETFSIVDDTAGLPPDSVLVTDRRKPTLDTSAFRKVVTVDYRPGYENDREGFPMPFPMYPRIYAHGGDREVTALRETPRHWRLFFGGDALAEKYAKSSTPTVYGKIPRGEVLDILRRHVSPSRWAEPATQGEMDALMNQGWDGVLVVNTRRVRIPPPEWLRTLAKAEFFLACPGVRYPMSHNLVESLSVGTVPVTEYPELFFPALEDGVNCLAYAGEAGLKAAADHALSMTPDDVRRLSAGAAEYYDRHVEPTAVVRKILEHPGKELTLRLLPFLRLGGGFA